MKRTTKAVLAATVGASLLLGGSTYALWSATAQTSTTATINTGTSELVSTVPGGWRDGVAEDKQLGTPQQGQPVVVDIDKYVTVPGDRLSYFQTYNLKTEGATTKTQVKMTFENDAATAVAWLRQRGVAIGVQFLDDKSRMLAMSPVVGDTLTTSYTLSGATPAEGMNIKVQIGFDFRASGYNSDEIKNLKIAIGNATVTAGQIS